MFGAKPFPSQIRIGADIAYIPRFEKLLRDRLPRNKFEHSISDDGQSRFYRHTTANLNHWVKRVLSRLEWPRFKFYLDLMVKNREPGKDPDCWPLATWMASRWAAKEAAVKAHRNRKLYLPQISIIKEPNHPRPIMLIDPPNVLVRMSAEVASKRAINTDPAEQKIDPRKLERWQQRGEVRKPRDLKAPRREEEQEEGERREDTQQQVYWRYKKVSMEERQEANVTISHDGDYAFASVQVLDDICPEEHQPMVIEDDGEGTAIHEPQYGDTLHAVLRPSFAFFANRVDPDGPLKGEDDWQADEYLGEYMQASAENTHRPLKPNVARNFLGSANRMGTDGLIKGEGNSQADEYLGEYVENDDYKPLKANVARDFSDSERGDASDSKKGDPSDLERRDSSGSVRRVLSDSERRDSSDSERKDSSDSER